MTDLRYILDKEEAEFGVGLYFKRDGEDKPQIIIRFLSYNCLYDGVTEMEKTLSEKRRQNFEQGDSYNERSLLTNGEVIIIY